MKKVSVIIPIFNMEMYLEKCIESVISQTYRCLEILLVNDGSTDNSIKICNDFAKKDKRIITLSKSNTGQADSRFAGFKNSTGEYIYCVDADDWLEPNAIELLVKGLEDTNSDMFFARYRLIDSRGHILKEAAKFSIQSINNNKSIIKDALCSSNIKASLCIKICRRKLWELCYIDEVRNIKFNEDYLLTVLFSIFSNNVGFSNDIVYNVLKRSGSVSRNVRTELVISHDVYFPIIYKKLKSVHCFEDAQKSYYVGFGKNIYYSLLIAATRLKNYSDFKSLYNLIPINSLYYSKQFIRTIRTTSLNFLILDRLSRSPRLFYIALKLLPIIFKY